MMYSQIAPDSAMVLPLSGMTGDLPGRGNGAQLFRGAHVRLALIADDLVGDVELFEQPQHTLRAGIVEMMNRQRFRIQVTPVSQGFLTFRRADLSQFVRFLRGRLTVS